MLIASKVNINNKSWIKVIINPPTPQLTSKMEKVGKYNPTSKLWAVDYNNKNRFIELMNEHFIIWTTPDEEENYSIDENKYNYPVNYTFKTTPFKYQLLGINCLLSNRALLLADEPGLGKTLQVVCALDILIQRGTLHKALVLCPATLCYNWRDEVLKHSNLRPLIIEGTVEKRCIKYSNLDDINVVILGYELMLKDIDVIQGIINNGVRLDCMILDEAHKIKNATSKIGEAVHTIKFNYKWAMTATPTPNSMLECYNYLKLFNLITYDYNRTAKQNWDRFKFSHSIMGGYGNKTVLGYKNMVGVRKLFGSRMLRRLKRDKLKDLPDVLFTTVTVNMTPEQQKLYKAIKNNVREDLKDLSDLESVESVLGKITRFQQCSDSPYLVGGKEVSAKLDSAMELIEQFTLAGEKVIIFTSFRGMIEMLEKRTESLNPAVIHGDVSNKGMNKNKALKIAKSESELLMLQASERSKQVKKFQEDPTCRLFIGSTKACREGITLTEASKVIFLDLEMTWDYIEQAYGRAHRIGQKNTVMVYFLISKNTIDERILSMVKSKRLSSEALLNGKTTDLVEILKEELN